MYLDRLNPGAQIDEFIRSTRLVSSFNFYWPGNLMLTDVPRQMSLYRFPGFTLISCLYVYIYIIVAHIALIFLYPK